MIAQPQCPGEGKSSGSLHRKHWKVDARLVTLEAPSVESWLESQNQGWVTIAGHNDDHHHDTDHGEVEKQSSSITVTLDGRLNGGKGVVWGRRRRGCDWWIAAR